MIRSYTSLVSQSVETELVVTNPLESITNSIRLGVVGSIME